MTPATPVASSTSAFHVYGITRDSDNALVAVYTDPSEARVWANAIEEETKQPHTIRQGVILLPEVQCCGGSSS